jgi:hypothetical protein
MPAINQDVTHWQGNTRVINIRVTDVHGGIVDLSGAHNVRWWMGKTAQATGSDIYVEKSLASGGGISLSQGLDNYWTVSVTLFPPDTQDVPSGRWYHECETIDAGGDVATVTIGRFILNPSLIPASLG